MSDSTSKLTRLLTTQAGKEVTANELFDAASHALSFGRRQSSSGLNFDYFGGRFLVDGVSSDVANGTVALTASTTNDVEATRAGVVSKNTTAFTPGSIALYKVVAGTASLISYEDHRPWVQLSTGRIVVSITSDANPPALTHGQATCDILEFTSSVSLTTTRTRR